MSENTPECAKLHHFKKYFSMEYATNTLAMYSKTSNSLKNITSILEYVFYKLALE